MKWLNNLPDDIIRYIKEFLLLDILVFTNKTYYNLYHYIIKNKIKKYELYVRHFIKRDFDIVFEQILGENIQLWLKNDKFIYKNMEFNNYIYFIMYYCIENDSKNCSKFMNHFLKERNLCKNLHKKNVIKYIKWTS
jgi:hypothetical protein